MHPAPPTRERSVSSVHSERRTQRALSQQPLTRSGSQVNSNAGDDGDGDAAAGDGGAGKSAAAGKSQSPFDQLVSLLHPPRAAQFSEALAAHLSSRSFEDAFASSSGDDAALFPRDGEGWTLLHEACAVGSVECVVACVEAGADVDGADASGITPAHVAALAPPDSSGKDVTGADGEPDEDDDGNTDFGGSRNDLLDKFGWQREFFFFFFFVVVVVVAHFSAVVFHTPPYVAADGTSRPARGLSCRAVMRTGRRRESRAGPPRSCLRGCSLPARTSLRGTGTA
jgi:hypothetical protein